MPFKPDCATSAGRMRDEHLECYDMSAADFARRCGHAAEFVQELLSDAVPPDSEAVQHFAKVFGGVAEAWPGIEREYRQKLARDAENRH